MLVRLCHTNQGAGEIVDKSKQLICNFVYNMCPPKRVKKAQIHDPSFHLCDVVHAFYSCILSSQYIAL
jgi:hypothetical protein